MEIPEPPKLKLKERFTNVCRTRHVSLATERSYWSIAVKFVAFTGAKSCDDLCDSAEDKFARFITHLARRGVSASTQNVNFNALIFLYQRVLGQTLGKLPQIERASRPSRLPNVPATHEDTLAIVESVNGDVGLALRLTYGAALRISDTLRIRLKDLDFKRGEILIRGSKGDKDRIVPMPRKLKAELSELVDRREREHEIDKRNGDAWVWLPNLYGTKNPKAHFDTQWQYLFGSQKITVDPQSGKRGRHHLMPETMQNAMREACRRLKLKKRVTPHGLRHAAAREIERRGTPVSEIQKLLGHAHVDTTMRYLGQGSGGKAKIIGPLD